MSQKELKKIIPPELRQGKYSNFFSVHGSGMEFTIDMFYRSPEAPEIDLLSRTIVSAPTAKRFWEVLGQMIEHHEANFGEIAKKPAEEIPEFLN